MAYVQQSDGNDGFMSTTTAMQEPAAASSQADENKSDLGINRSIYAAGYSFKDSLIAFVAVWFAAAAALTFGMSKNIGAAKWILNKTGQFHEKYKNAVQGHLLGKMFSPAVVAVSGVIGYAVSHIVMAPSAAAGWRKAQQAIDKHAAVIAENARLEKENRALAHEIAQLDASPADAEKQPAGVREIMARGARPVTPEMINAERESSALAGVQR